MDDLKFEKGQLLSYGTSGICVVDDITKMRITSDAKPEVYYILKQKKDSDSRIFVPVNNARLTSKMRDLMNAEEIEALVLGMNEESISWDNDRRARNDLFHNILMNGVSMDLLRMIVCIYKHKKNLTEAGKKLPVTDANTLKSAERLVTEEFACVLGIEQNDVNDYIQNVLNRTKENGTES